MQPVYTTIDEMNRLIQEGGPVQKRKFSADRTVSSRRRAGSRRNKKIKNVPPFFSDWWGK